MPDKLTALYEHTQYRVRLARGGCAIIRVHQPLPPALRAMLPTPEATWAFITAWNPYSRTQPTKVNRASQRQLLTRLHQLVPEPRIAAAVGMSDAEPHWREPSLFAAGVRLDHMDDLMLAFEQHTIVCGHGDGPAELRWAPT